MEERVPFFYRRRKERGRAYMIFGQVRMGPAGEKRYRMM